MRNSLLLMLALTVGLSACGGLRESRLNPFNWFGRSEVRASRLPPDERAKYAAQSDRRPLVDQVVAMSIESVPEGAILRATGLPSTQGYWDAELVQVTGDNIDPGVLVFDFRLVPPPYRATAGTEYSRQVEVATYLSFVDLDGVSRIVVRGQRTERVARR